MPLIFNGAAPLTLAPGDRFGIYASEAPAALRLATYTYDGTAASLIVDVGDFDAPELRVEPNGPETLSGPYLDYLLRPMRIILARSRRRH